jgi:hypothetical protein
MGRREFRYTFPVNNRQLFRDKRHIESKSEHLEGAVKVLKEGEEWELVVTLKGTPPAGQFAGQLVLHTDSAVCHEVPINAMGYVQPPPPKK